MVEVKPNTFYKKQDITKGVSVNPQFADLPVGSLDDVVPLVAGLGATKYVLSGSVPAVLPFGGGELVGGAARFLTSGVSYSDTGKLPNLELYRVKDEIPLIEDSTELSTGGDSLFVMGTFVDSALPYLTESFEGQDKTISISNYVIADSGKGSYDLSNVILGWEAARDTLWFGGVGFLGFGPSDIIQCLFTYFTPSAAGFDISSRDGIHVMPVDRNNITGKWTAQFDARDDWSKWAVIKPYWKWNDIKRHLNFNPRGAASAAPVQTSLDETPDTSTHNTLWTHIATTPNQNDPFDVSLDNPIISAESTLDSSETDSIGNAQKITQYWGTPSVKEVILDVENFFSPQYSRKPQMTRFSFDKIPKPGIIDMGNYPYARYAKTGDTNYENRSNDTRLSLPEISMKVNFKNLPPSLPINIDLGNNDSAGIGCAAFITRGETFPLWDNPDDSLATAMNWTESTFGPGYHILSGGTGVFRPFAPKGTYTLQRCVAITFSNYAPLEEHDTLDKFLYYGLTNFYNKGQVKDGIVGGALFVSFEQMDPTDSTQTTAIGFSAPGNRNNMEPNRVYAVPIPVVPVKNSIAVNRMQSGSTLDGAYGLAAVGGPNFDCSVSGAIGPKILWQPEFGSDNNNNWMSLPKDSWSDLRWVFDPYAESDVWWTRGGAQSGAAQFSQMYWTGTSATGNIAHGSNPVPATRASGPLLLYSHGERYRVGWNKDSPSPAEDEDVPFIKIPFPSSYWRAKPMSTDGVAANTLVISGTTGNVVAGSDTFVVSGGSAFTNTAISIGDNLVIDQGEFASLPASSQNASGFISLGTVADLTISTDVKAVTVELAEPIPVAYGALSVSSGSSTRAPLYRNGCAPNTPSLAAMTDDNFSPGSYYLAKGTGDDSWWPHVMTVWMQNYRWTNGSGSGDPDYFNGMSLYKYYDQQLTPDGKGMELDFLIDEIEFKNFTTEKQNASAGRGGNSDLLRIQEGVTSTNKDTNGVLVSGTYDSHSKGGVYFPGFTSGSQFKERPTGYNILIGFDDKENLPLEAATSGNYGNILWNTFNTQSFTDLPRVGGSWPFTEWAYLSLCSGQGVNALDGTAALKLGNQLGVASYGSGSIHGDASAGYKTWTYSGGSALSGSALAIVTGSGDFNASSSALWIGSGSNDYKGTDGFTQKGLTPLVVMNSGAAAEKGDAENKWDDWIAREHILASVKIIGAPGNIVKGGDRLEDTQIMVDDYSIFNEYGDSEYIIYRLGQPLTNAQLSGTAASSKALGFTKSIKIASGTSTNTQIINFDTPLNVADDGDVNLFGRGEITYDADNWFGGGNTVGVPKGDEFLNEMYISPKKYWLHVPIFNSPRVTGAAGIANFRKYGDATGSAYIRSYDSACMIASSTSTITSGTTYNEFSYSYILGNTGSKGASAVYEHPWILEPNGGEDTSLILEDYGFGNFEASSMTGGMLSKTPALMNLSGSVNRYTEFPLEGYVDTASPEAGTVLNFTMAISGALNKQTQTFYGDDNSNLDYRPHLLWSYKDTLPVVDKLMVKPTVDVINEEVDLYSLTNENLNAVKFTWEEEADDSWYRMLFINDGDIPHKYTNSTFWLPLNDKPTIIASSTAHNWYNNVDNTSGTADIVGDLTTSTIEGLQGYATTFASGGTTSGTITISGETHSFVSGMTEYTLQAHVIPSVNDKGKDSYIMTYMSGATGGGLEMWLNSDGRVQAKISGTANNLSGTSIASPYDGQTPTSVMLTFQSGNVTGPDAQLFVNGIREAYDNSANVIDITGNLVIGASGGAASQAVAEASGNFLGSIEEIVLWNKKYEIPEQAGEFIFDNAGTEDITTGRQQIAHNARVFVFDYHNIRGKNANEVAKTNTTSWRA